MVGLDHGEDRRNLLGYLAIVEAAVSAVGVVTLALFFGIVATTGAPQPWGTINDISGLLFFVVLTSILLLTRRVVGSIGWKGARWVSLTGFASAGTGIAGSTMLVFEELGGPTFGAGGYLAGVGLGIQYVATVLLVGWCVSFGYQLKLTGWPKAMRWGLAGATFFGAPFWFAWIGKQLLAPPRS